jgi:hypothetical protein
LLECLSAWDGNGSYDNFVVFSWLGPNRERLLVVVNYADNRSQCYVRLPFDEFAGRPLRLKDLMAAVQYDRDGNEVLSRGLYLDLPSWGYHVFQLTRV